MIVNVGKMFCVVLIVVGLVLSAAWCTTRIVLGITWSVNCTGRLKRAADANTIELASEELTAALSYIDKSLPQKTGYTSIIYNSPSEDVGFWVKNLTQSLTELKSVSPDASQLEKSNVLMKLRETLLDSTEHGTRVTCPRGISVFPHNLATCLFGVFSLLGVCAMTIVYSRESYFE